MLKTNSKRLELNNYIINANCNCNYKKNIPILKNVPINPLIIVIGGPAGTGKSTTASKLATQLNCSFIEGDKLHSLENIEKMSQNIPLTDEDRWSWLSSITISAVEDLLNVRTRNTKNITVVTCSILKRKYRQYITEQLQNITSSMDNSVKEINILYVFLYADKNTIIKRTAQRKNHYMKSTMVQSQFDIMELPKDDELIDNLNIGTVESGNSVIIDTDDKNPFEIIDEIKSTIDKVYDNLY